MLERFLWLFLVLMLCLNVFLWFQVANSTVPYTNETLTVTDTKTVFKPGSGFNKSEYKVFVDFKGEKTELENLRGRRYSKGMNVNTYIYKDRVFADIEGVKTSTSLANIYFISLVVTPIVFIAALTKTIERRKSENRV